MSAAAVPRPDPFVRAHQDAHKAVALFLPSVVGRQEAQAPPPPPNPMAPPLDSVSEAMRVISLANRGEKMSARVARGLPAEEPQSSPEREFGNQLDSVHTRAIQEAIAAHPEEDRGRLISEAHDSAVKWIAAHNGKVVVHGKIELAHSPESAERLAANIVNNEVEGHDQRRAANAEVDGAQSARATGVPESSGTPDQPSDARGGANAPGADGAVPPVQASPLPMQPVSGPTQPGDQPQIVPPGDGQPPATGAPPAVTQPEVQKVGTRKGDGHQITQPKNSIASNQKLALDAAPELHQALQTLSAQVPGTKFDRLRPQKSTDRLDQKVEDANDPNTLSDYLGAQVSADTPQAKDAMVAALKKSFKVIEVDDQFLKGRKDKAQYPSTNVQVQLRNGMTAEVQIVPREVQDATEQSHAFYKAGREAEDRGDNAERDRQWKQAGDINQGALRQFKARNGIQDQSAKVGDYEIMGEPITVGKHTFLRVRQGGGSGAALPVPVESDGSQGATVPSAGAGNDEQLPGGVPQGQVPSGDQSQRIAKGQSVTLQDGSPAEVTYVHPELNAIRVRTADGQNLRLNPKELASAAAE